MAASAGIQHGKKGHPGFVFPLPLFPLDCDDGTECGLLFMTIKAARVPTALRQCVGSIGLGPAQSTVPMSPRYELDGFCGFDNKSSWMLHMLP